MADVVKKQNYETVFVLSARKEWENGKPKVDADGNPILVKDAAGLVQYDVLAESEKGLAKIADLRVFPVKGGYAIKRFVGERTPQTTFADVRARIFASK